jgi:hypothetical protein
VISRSIAIGGGKPDQTSTAFSKCSHPSIAIPKNFALSSHHTGTATRRYGAGNVFPDLVRGVGKKKARSMSTTAQPVNGIRRNETAISGSLIMGNSVHQQNLAHCRRLLAEAELATSGDEIRHSKLMRLLAEEEANGLLIADYDDRACLGPRAVH